MKVYVIKVTTNGTPKQTYIDSIWENLQDAEQHIEYCQNKEIFDNTTKAEVEAIDVYKHFE